ncbi:MAG: hypothetical protein V2B14_04860 [bacterium]
MLNKRTIEYPAFIYQKKGVFMADCTLFNLAALGKTEIEAVENLQRSMNHVLHEYDILIKPIYNTI